MPGDIRAGFQEGGHRGRVAVADGRVERFVSTVGPPLSIPSDTRHRQAGVQVRAPTPGRHARDAALWRAPQYAPRHALHGPQRFDGCKTRRASHSPEQLRKREVGVDRRPKRPEPNRVGPGTSARIRTRSRRHGPVTQRERVC